MILTEAIIFYNMSITPSRSWIETHFTHFRPSDEDFALRRKYKKAQEKLKITKMVMEDIFE